jgi:hypothetical protein
MERHHLPEKFSHAVDIVKREAKVNKSIDLTDEQIAEGLKISLIQYHGYYQANEVSRELSEQLYAEFKNYLKPVYYDTIEFEIDIPDDEV